MQSVNYNAIKSSFHKSKNDFSLKMMTFSGRYIAKMFSLKRFLES